MAEAMIISGSMTAGIRGAGFQAGLSPFQRYPQQNTADSENTCPKCGGHPPYCCSYEDKASISDDAYARYQQAQQQEEAEEQTVSGLALREKDQAEEARQPALNPEPSGDGEADQSATGNAESAADNAGSASEIDPAGDAAVGATKQSGSRAEDESNTQAAPTRQLDKEEQKEVEELKKRDAKVRQHEQAHLAAAGHLASGGARFEYETGPDGRQYATGGHVSVSVGGGDTPEERYRNATQAERAALAPAEPSPQDRKVAAEARQVATEAQQDMTEERAEEANAMQESAGRGETTAQAEQAGTQSSEAPQRPDEQSALPPYPGVGPAAADPQGTIESEAPRESQRRPMEPGGMAGGMMDPLSPFAPYHRQAQPVHPGGENSQDAAGEDTGNGAQGQIRGQQGSTSIWSNGMAQSTASQQSGGMMENQDDNPLKRASDAYKRNSDSTAGQSSTKKLTESTTRNGALMNRVA